MRGETDERLEFHLWLLGRVMDDIDAAHKDLTKGALHMSICEIDQAIMHCDAVLGRVTSLGAYQKWAQARVVAAERRIHPMEWTPTLKAARPTVFRPQDVIGPAEKERS